MRALSPRLLRDLTTFLDKVERGCGPWSQAAAVLLERIDALAKPKHSVKLARKRVAAKKRSHAQETKAIRAEVVKRAMGVCEASHYLSSPCRGHLEMDHFRGGVGRRKAQESVAGCWMLCSSHHDEKTRNLPTAGTWLEVFAEHCRVYGYEAELAETQARLDSLEMQGRAG